MYAAIRQTKVKPGMVEELTQRIQDEAVPVLSGVSGFQAFYAVHGADDSLTTISIYDSQANAEEANRVMVGWIRENLAPLLSVPPTPTEGNVIVYSEA
jgi:hypothetical protein